MQHNYNTLQTLAISWTVVNRLANIQPDIKNCRNATWRSSRHFGQGAKTTRSFCLSVEKTDNAYRPFTSYKS